MSSTQTLESKLKLLTVLAENSGTWMTKTKLAEMMGSQPERIAPTLASFERQEFVKFYNWELLSKIERDDITKNNNIEIHAKTKKIYQINQDGWQTLKNSLQDCFQDENVFNLMNIPENIKSKLF
jgi:hypothetical protein